MHNLNFFLDKTAHYFCSIFWSRVLCHRVICLYWIEVCVNSAKVQVDVFFVSIILKEHIHRNYYYKSVIYIDQLLLHTVQNCFEYTFDFITCPRKASWDFSTSLRIGFFFEYMGELQFLPGGLNLLIFHVFWLSFF